MRCLVVDDSELSLEMTAMLVEEMGVETVSAISAEKAMELFSSGDRFDLILMDYRMPGMDGAQCASLLREQGYEGIILGMSGDTDKETTRILYGAGMDAVLGKPLEPGGLAKWIGRINPDGIQMASQNSTQESSGEMEKIFSETHFDAAKGIHFSGSEKLYSQYLLNFAKLSQGKLSLIRDCLEKDDIRRFTIEVHALKSNARSLGNDALSELARLLEEAGDREDRCYIKDAMDSFVELYKDSSRQVLDRLKVGEQKNSISSQEIMDVLAALKDAILSFDLDSADDCVSYLREVHLPEKSEELFGKLECFIADVDMEHAEKTLEQLKASI